MTKRIWELDALRGVCILGMVLVHLVYDLASGSPITLPGWFLILQNWGGVLFFLISGISVTRGKRSLRRGITVFVLGMGITLCTSIFVILGSASGDCVIWFGVLHCLGLCMILWPVFGRFPSSVLLIVSIVSIAAGVLLPRFPVNTPLLLWLGLMPTGFSSPDYFPLLPFFGFFLLGSIAGRRLYPNGQSLFPTVSGKVFSFFARCGRHSLIIYLAHQPLLLLLLRLMPF